MKEATPLHGIVQVARTVTGKKRNRHGLGGDRTELGNTYLILAQVLEQEGLKGLVGTVHLVDQ